MVDAIVTLTKSNWHVSHLSEMSEKIAKKMEMIQNLRGVDVMKKRDLMMLMICHVVNILSSMMVTTMMMKQWIGFSVAPCIKLYK